MFIQNILAVTIFTETNKSSFLTIKKSMFLNTTIFFKTVKCFGHRFKQSYGLRIHMCNSTQEFSKNENEKKY